MTGPHGLGLPPLVRGSNLGVAGTSAMLAGRGVEAAVEGAVGPAATAGDGVQQLGSSFPVLLCHTAVNKRHTKSAGGSGGYMGDFLEYCTLL